MSEKTFVTFTFHAPFLRKLLENIYQPNKRNKSGNGIQKTEDGEGGGNPPDTGVKPGDNPPKTVHKSRRTREAASSFHNVSLKRKCCEAMSCDIHGTYCGEDAVVHVNANYCPAPTSDTS